MPTSGKHPLFDLLLFYVLIFDLILLQQPIVYNVSDFSNVPNFLEAFDCSDGERSSLSLVAMEGEPISFLQP